MLQAGSYHTLTISRISPHGIYLSDEEGAEVLLPNRFVSLADKIGDVKEVFLYHDSEERLVATTMHPLAIVGQVALMDTVGRTTHGAFMEWGEDVPKDVFVPHRNQHVPLEVGKQYLIYIYNDTVTGRVTGTAKLRGVISNENVSVKQGDEVEIVIGSKVDLGYRCVVANRHWGMLYDSQIFRPITLGERTKAYVVKITEDNRIDLSLQAGGYDEIKMQSERLLELARKAGGALPLGDKASPEDVAALTQMSKKVFKRTLGYLLKQGIIELSDDGFKIKS